MIDKKEHASTIRAMRAAFSMTKQRCLNPNCRDYKHYGGRGITIDESWLQNFDNFLNDMGLRPSPKHTLERSENDGPYNKSNCVWALRYEQASNTRQCKMITYMGETHTVSDWEILMGFKPGTLKARLGSLGYSIQDAFEKPVRSGLMLNNKTYPKVVASADVRVRALASAERKKPALTPEMVAEAKKLVTEGLSRSAVGRRFGVSVTTISSAVDNLRAYK